MSLHDVYADVVHATRSARGWCTSAQHERNQAAADLILATPQHRKLVRLARLAVTQHLGSDVVPGIVDEYIAAIEDVIADDDLAATIRGET